MLFLVTKGFSLPVTCVKPCLYGPTPPAVALFVRQYRYWAVLSGYALLLFSPYSPHRMSFDACSEYLVVFQFRCPKGDQLCPAGAPLTNLVPDLVKALDNSNLVQALASSVISALTGVASPTSSGFQPITDTSSKKVLISGRAACSSYHT